MNADIKNHIISSLDWLLNLGFKEVSHPEELIYENNHIRLSISFFKSFNDLSLPISIKKIGENKSYFLNEFLEHIGKKKVSFIANESEVEFVNRNLNALKSLIGNELKEVITGSNWIEVPRDYMEYR